MAPIPGGLQEKIELAQEKKTDNVADLDFANLLSQEHLQYLNSTFLGKKGTREGSQAKHPGWERTANAIRTSSNSLTGAPEGLSSTITEAIGELATNISNLWNGATYSKAQDYLLRILLRLHLAPKRESKYQKMIHSKEQKQKAKSDEAPLDRRAQQRRLTRLCDDLSDVLASGDNVRIGKRVPVLLELLSRAMQPPSAPQVEPEAGSKDSQEDASDDVKMYSHDADLVFGDVPEDEGKQLKASFKSSLSVRKLT